MGGWWREGFAWWRVRWWRDRSLVASLLGGEVTGNPENTWVFCCPCALQREFVTSLWRARGVA